MILQAPRYTQQSMVDPAGPKAVLVDHFWHFLIITASIVTAIVFIALLVALFKRRRPVDPEEPAVQGSLTRWVSASVAMTLVIIVVFLFTDYRLGRAMHFADHPELKVPHMGWNQLEVVGEPRLLKDIPRDAYFYFVHSYFPNPAAGGLVAAESVYGVPFACAAARDNVFAVQFHPEKSQAAGLKLLANFIAWQPSAQRSKPTAASPAA